MMMMTAMNAASVDGALILDDHDQNKKVLLGYKWTRNSSRSWVAKKGLCEELHLYHRHVKKK